MFFIYIFLFYIFKKDVGKNGFSWQGHSFFGGGWQPGGGGGGVWQSFTGFGWQDVGGGVFSEQEQFSCGCGV